MSTKTPDDVAAAWGRMVAAAGKAKTPGFSVKSKLALERPPVPPTDGRRKRGKGERTQQLNVKMKPPIVAELKTLAKQRDIGLAEMLERMLSEWKALGGKGLSSA
jgi:hypothetical protein